jgi:hypothetical protein
MYNLTTENQLQTTGVMKKTVKKLTTEEFAKVILENPGKIISFTTSLNDYGGEWAWYTLANVTIIEVQTVIINHPLGGRPYAFDIIDFNVDAQESLDYDAALEEVIEGLRVSGLNLGGDEPDAWYLNVEDEPDEIHTLCTTSDGKDY